MAWRAASSGQDIGAVFLMLLGISASMTLVHVYGALRRIQPWTETAEIAFYAGLFALAWCFFPAS